jgi:hypothetical protein
MFWFRATWLALLATTAILFVLNWQCWRPGVGVTVGGMQPGTHLEQSFGWPATYQAELWLSDDQALASRIIDAAPFYYPDGEMTLEQRVFGLAAFAVDLGFALLVLLSVALVAECSLRQVWSARGVLLLACVGALLVGLWLTSASVSISL